MNTNLHRHCGLCSSEPYSRRDSPVELVRQDTPRKDHRYNPPRQKRAFRASQPAVTRQPSTSTIAYALSAAAVDSPMCSTASTYSDPAVTAQYRVRIARMEDWKDWKTRKFWIGLLALALVTAALEHLLTLSASGALKAWGRLLEIASFGSERLQDAPFAAAALNSYPLPSLILLLAVIFVAGGYVANGVGHRIGAYIAKEPHSRSCGCQRSKRESNTATFFTLFVDQSGRRCVGSVSAH